MASFAQAQDSERIQTLFSGKSRVTGFGSLINQVNLAKNDKIRSFYSIGAEGGLLFNRSFYIGIYGMTSLSPTDISTLGNGSITTDNRNIRLIQTGGLIGYKFFPTKLVHLNFSTKIGGAFMIDEKHYNSRYRDAEVSQAFYIVNPMLNVEVNVFRWMQAFAGVGYSFMSGKETFGINPNEDLSATTLQFGFSFGKF
ncbi:MAG: hypothetical protein OHK0057_06120 [Thermoflexibacter sp.]